MGCRGREGEIQRTRQKSKNTAHSLLGTHTTHVPTAEHRTRATASPVKSYGTPCVYLAPIWPAIESRSRWPCGVIRRLCVARQGVSSGRVGHGVRGRGGGKTPQLPRHKLPSRWAAAASCPRATSTHVTSCWWPHPRPAAPPGVQSGPALPPGCSRPDSQRGPPTGRRRTPCGGPPCPPGCARRSSAPRAA